MYFTGTVVIKGKKIGRPNERFTFHQNGLKITSATITKHDKKNGDQDIAVERINLHKSLDEVRVHAQSSLYAGDYTVAMEFEAPITRGMTGLYPCFFKKDGKEEVLLATQFESHHAREVFPCIDEPEAKATFDLALTTEPGLTVLGNQPVKASLEQDGFTVTTFETSPKMSSYLLAFVIGNLHNKSAKTKSGVEVSIWGTVAQPIESFDFALDAAVQAIEFFEDYFDVPYPLPKADHVALPDFSSGAMENWGLITYREAVLLLYPDAISQSTKELIALVIAHETSHQWFGNLVTMKWWDDLWLNESFANMMEYEAVNHMFPDWHVWDTFITAEGLSAYRRDATPGVQAVKTEVNHPDEISTLFDPSIVYAKGGRLLFMLKNYLGENAWRTGLKAYFTEHSYQNTEGKDLWKSLSDASKIDVAAFMNPWLERSGFPVVSVDQKDQSLTLTQQHFLENPAKADPDRIWPVPTFINQPDAPIVLDNKTLTCEVAADIPVVVNAGARGHYITQYVNTSHKQALTMLVKEQKLDTIDRLMLLSNSAMLARAGYESLADTLALMRAYTAEATEPVWDVMSLVIADARRFINADESIEPAIKMLIRDLIVSEYKRLGWEEQPTDSAADQKLRGTILGLGAYAEEPTIVKQAIKLFENYKQDTAAVSAELRGIVFTVAIKEHVPGALDYLLELHAKTNSSDLQRDISGAATATRNVDEAKQILSLLQDPKIIKPQDADRWLFYLLRNRYMRDTAWQWMEDNWQWIEDTYQKDKSYDYFPRYAAAVCNTKEQQERYINFFKSKLVEPMLKRNIEIGLEEIANRVAWIERDISHIQAFFTVQ
jgi:aminopeptidase N